MRSLLDRRSRTTGTCLFRRQWLAPSRKRLGLDTSATKPQTSTPGPIYMSRPTRSPAQWTFQFPSAAATHIHLLPSRLIPQVQHFNLLSLKPSPKKTSFVKQLSYRMGARTPISFEFSLEFPSPWFRVPLFHFPCPEHPFHSTVLLRMAPTRPVRKQLPERRSENSGSAKKVSRFHAYITCTVSRRPGRMTQLASRWSCQ